MLPLAEGSGMELVRYNRGLHSRHMHPSMHGPFRLLQVA